MTHNQDRVLTLVVQIKDPEAAQELWDSHLAGKLVAGCQILSLANGDLNERYDRLNAIMGAVHEYLSNNLGDAEAEALLDRIDEFDNPPMTPEQKALTDKLRKQIQEKSKLTCTCGEDDEAFMTLTSPQHSEGCPKYGM